MKRYNVRMKVDAAVGRKFKHALLTVQSHLAYPMHADHFVWTLDGRAHNVLHRGLHDDIVRAVTGNIHIFMGRNETR